VDEMPLESVEVCQKGILTHAIFVDQFSPCCGIRKVEIGFEKGIGNGVKRW